MSRSHERTFFTLPSLASIFLALLTLTYSALPFALLQSINLNNLPQVTWYLPQTPTIPDGSPLAPLLGCLILMLCIVRSRAALPASSTRFAHKVPFRALHLHTPPDATINLPKYGQCGEIDRK